MVAAVRLIVSLALVVLSAHVGSAQSSRPPRPFAALFGPTELDLKRPARLDVNWSLYEAKDDTSFLTSDADILDPALQSNRSYTGVAISLAHVRRMRRSVLNMNVASAGRFYGDLHQVVTTRHGGMVSFDTYPSKDWRVQFSNGASFSPFYRVVLGPSGAALRGDSPTPTDDYSVSKQRAMQYSSSWGVTHTYDPQTMLMHGFVGMAGATNPYHGYSSTTRFEFALRHRVALYAEHVFYRYAFASADGLPAFLTTGMNRRGARMGLSLWTPLAR